MGCVVLTMGFVVLCFCLRGEVTQRESRAVEDSRQDKNLGPSQSVSSGCRNRHATPAAETTGFDLLTFRRLEFRDPGSGRAGVPRGLSPGRADGHLSVS